MLKYLPALLDRPELAEHIERLLPSLPNREAVRVNAAIHQAAKRRRFHERHATRQRRLAAELIADARAAGVTVWE